MKIKSSEFLIIGKARDEDKPGAGEIYAIY